LIILIIFNSAGYVFTYWQLKMIFRKTAEENCRIYIPEEKLQILIVHNDGKRVLPENWEMENDQEFRYNNEMYDVVRSEVKGDFIYYYCRKDDNENRLESAFITYVQETSGTLAGTIPVKNLIKSFSGDWENARTEIYFYTGTRDLILTSEYKTLPAHSLIHTPPPRPYYS
jgi:hypothetical protein